MSYKNKETLLSLRDSGLSDPQIGEIYGVSGPTIRYYRKKHGIVANFSLGNNRKYTTNQSFFREIDDQYKAYILGLIASDGYISQSNRLVSIALSKEDEHILSDVLMAMNSSSSIRTKRKKKLTGFGGVDLSVIYICGVHLVEDLFKLGITRNKSNTLIYPSGIPDDLHSHFIRGLWDGDGNINHINFSLAGTNNLLSATLKIIEDKTGCAGNIQIDKRGYSRLYYYRKHASVLKWLYSDSSIRLNRKYQQFLMYWS